MAGQHGAGGAQLVLRASAAAVGDAGDRGMVGLPLVYHQVL